MCEFASLMTVVLSASIKDDFINLPSKEAYQMKSTMFVRAEEVAEDLEVSKPHAYKLIREMNEELKERGYMTVSGRISRQFYEERFYGVAEGKEGG